MHAQDLIYMAYFDPHRGFDGLTSYIHSMRRHLLTYFLRRAIGRRQPCCQHARPVAAARPVHAA